MKTMMKSLLVLAVLLVVPATSWGNPPWWRPQDLHWQTPVVPGPWNGLQRPPQSTTGFADSPNPQYWWTFINNDQYRPVTFYVNGQQYQVPANSHWINPMWNTTCRLQFWNGNLLPNGQQLWRDNYLPGNRTVNFWPQADGSVEASW